MLFMDADGATRVSDIEKLESKLRELKTASNGRVASGGDRSIAQNGVRETRRNAGGQSTTDGDGDESCYFVLGSRAHLQDAAIAQRTWIRNILMHGFHALVTLVIGNSVRDTQCGFKV